MTQWKSKNRHKYLIQFHIIFVCKYRKALLADPAMAEDVKRLSAETCPRHAIEIKRMECDRDHIRHMVGLEPTMSVSKGASLMKGYTTYHVWRLHEDRLRREFWRERTFWTDGHSACSVGSVSERTLRAHIENQG